MYHRFLLCMKTLLFNWVLSFLILGHCCCYLCQRSRWHSQSDWLKWWGFLSLSVCCMIERQRGEWKREGGRPTGCLAIGPGSFSFSEREEISPENKLRWPAWKKEKRERGLAHSLARSLAKQPPTPPRKGTRPKNASHFLRLNYYCMVYTLLLTFLRWCSGKFTHAHQP